MQAAITKENEQLVEQFIDKARRLNSTFASSKTVVINGLLGDSLKLAIVEMDRDLKIKKR